METKFKENLIQEATRSPEETREGFEMSAEEAKQITAELSKLNDSIVHDKPILIDDIEDLSKVARGTKIDVGGEVMTVEEAEQIQDLKMNVEIWNEMREGKFDNTKKLTRITPTVSKCLEKIKGNINLACLVFAKGLVLPEIIRGNLYLASLISAERLVFPKVVRGNLQLDSLTSAKGLVLPETIISSLYLRELTSIKDLILPKTIYGDIFLFSVSPLEKEELKKKYPQYKDKIK